MTITNAPTVAALQLLAGPFADNDTAIVDGYFSSGDLGGGTFYFESAPPSTATVTGAAGASVNITNATNADPIAITAPAHGYVDGQVVAVAGVGGNTAANGVWSVRVTGPSTFVLNGSVGNGAYSGGGTCSTTTITTSGAHGLVSGQRVIIAGVAGNTAANSAEVATVTSANTFSIGVASNGTYTTGGTVGDGGTAIPSSVTPGRWKRSTTDIYSVREFGARADCDGHTGTDDSGAFNSAIAAGQRHYSLVYGIGTLSGGFSVLIPPGNYYLTRTLELPDRCSLIGSGSPWTTALFFDTPPSPLASPWGDGILLDQGPQNRSTNAQLKGFAIYNVRQGSAARRAQNEGSGIELIGTANIKIEDLIIAGFKRGVTLDASNDVSIERVTFGSTSLTPYSGYPNISEGPYGDDVGLWCAACGAQATYMTTAANVASLVNGDTLVLGFDQSSIDFVVTFALGDTIDDVVAKINAAAHSAYADTFVYASNVGGQLHLTGKEFGIDKGQIRVVGGSSVHTLGLDFPAVLLGTGANYASLVDGDTLVLNIDGKGRFTTTFSATDGAYPYPPGGRVVSAITAAANANAGDFFPYVSLVGGEVRIQSKLMGAAATIEVISGSAVAKLGLTIGTTLADGGVQLAAGNGHGTEPLASSGLVNGVFVKECQLGGTTNVWEEDGICHVFENCNVEGGRIARLTGCHNSTWRNIMAEGTNFGELFLVDGQPYNVIIDNCFFQGFSHSFHTAPGTSMIGFDSAGSVHGLSVRDTYFGGPGPDSRPVINTIEAYPGSGNTYNVLDSCMISNLVNGAQGTLIGYSPVECSVLVFGNGQESRGMLGVNTAKPVAQLDVGAASGFSRPLAAFQVRSSLAADTPAVFVSNDFARHEHGLGRVNFGGLLQQGVIEYFGKGDIPVGSAGATFEYDRADNAAFDVEIHVVTHCYGSSNGKRWTLRRFGVTYGTGDVVLDSSNSEDTSREINGFGPDMVFVDPVVDVNPATHKIRLHLSPTTGDSADLLRYLVYTRIVARSVF